MANRFAVANGNWSNTATWNGGTLPTAADDVFANNFTVTIDQNVTALSLRTEAAAGINAGGGFTLSASYDISADLYSGSSTCVTFSANSPAVTNITGNLYGSTTSTTSDLRAFNHTGTGTSNITGNLLGGTGATGQRRVAARLAGIGAMNINGNITGNSGNLHYGLTVDAAGTVTVVGNLLTNGNFAINISSGSLTVTGTLVSGSSLLISSVSCNVTVNGNQSSSSGSTVGLISHGTSGTLTINGSLTHGTSSSSGINLLSVGNAANTIINGNLISNTSGNSGHTLLNISGIGTHTVTGNLIRNSNSRVIFITSPSLNNLNIIGDISSTLSANSPTVSVSGGTNLTVTGNITGNLGGINQQGNISVGGSGLITINGNVTGGSVSQDTAIVSSNTSTSNIIVNGTVTAGSASAAYGIYHAGSGTITVTRVVGNGYGVGSTGIGESYAIFNSIAATIFGEIIVQEFEFGSRGAVPVRGFCRIASSSNRVAFFRNAAGTQITLVDPSTIVTPPLASDVRLGVSYYSGNFTGTLAVPNFDNVAFGIPVDSGIGTAILKPQDVWNYMRNNITGSGTIGERLKNAATIQSVGDQIAAF